MFEINEISLDYHFLDENGYNHITDNMNPVISFNLRSDRSDVSLRSALISVNNWEIETKDQLFTRYEGKSLAPFSEYRIHITAWDDEGNECEKSVFFRTGRLDRPWQGKWITDASYKVESPQVPKPLTFKKDLLLEEGIKELHILTTAMGIYDLYFDGKRINDEYFAPGFTDYDFNLQYGYYRVEDVTAGKHELIFIVASGWAIGRSTHIADTNKSKSLIMSDKEKLLTEIRCIYNDGVCRVVGSDESFLVSTDGPYEFADFYDGEIYDATFENGQYIWKSADVSELSAKPNIRARYGEKVLAHEVFSPVDTFVSEKGELIYSFEQNISGILRIEISGKAGQKITIRHAEAIENGDLYVQNLRSAKQELVYICKDGFQIYEPRFTFMGFQHIGVSGVSAEHIKITAIAIYSDLEIIGDFECSNEDLNKLQQNLKWSGKDNFVDIPTDCPQRDERQGWTGDIAIFSQTAAFNFNTDRFLEKWLLDLRHEQTKLGAIPFVVPERKGITTKITTSCWGDSCILVPYSLYRSFGNKDILEKMYPTMKRFLADISRWAIIGAPMNKSRYILSLPFQFGDWCAPYGSVPDWLKKGPWVGTAYYYNSCRIMSEIAEILGKTKDIKYYESRAEKIRNAFFDRFCDETGKMPEDQAFQTGYVLPLYFQMAKNNLKAVMADELVRLVKENKMHLSTGFTATPYILFAMADAGYVDEAYELLLQDTNPSWLYQVRHGATTMWEQWDIVQEDGYHKEGSMNHYSYGAVGDFFYRRICGLEPLSSGYKDFVVKPIIGGGLKYAYCWHKSMFGDIRTGWEIVDKVGKIYVDVPVNCRAVVELPDGVQKEVGSGHYEFEWETDYE